MRRKTNGENNLNKKLIFIFVIIFITFACATQRFGRMQHVTQIERTILDCNGLEVEIAKTQGFLDETTHQDEKFITADLLGFLGDFGIGNAMEYSDAMESGNMRLDELNELKDNKNCSFPSQAIK